MKSTEKEQLPLNEWRVATLANIMASLLRCRIMAVESEGKLMYKDPKTNQHLFALRNNSIVKRFVRTIYNDCIRPHAEHYKDALVYPQVVVADRTFDDDPGSIPSSCYSDHFQYGYSYGVSENYSPFPLFCTLYPSTKNNGVKPAFNRSCGFPLFSKPINKENSYLASRNTSDLFCTGFVLGPLFSIACTNSIFNVATKSEERSSVTFELVDMETPAAQFMQESVAAIRKWFFSRETHSTSSVTIDTSVIRPLIDLAVNIASCHKTIRDALVGIQIQPAFRDLSRRYDKIVDIEQVAEIADISVSLPTIMDNKGNPLSSPMFPAVYARLKGGHVGSFERFIKNVHFDYRMKYANPLRLLEIWCNGPTVDSLSCDVMETAVILNMLSDNQILEFARKVGDIERGIQRFSRFMDTISTQLALELLAASV